VFDLPSVLAEARCRKNAGRNVPRTEIGLVVPASEDEVVSAAVIVLLPALRRVTLKLPTPAVRGELAGSVASPSVLVKRTVPPYAGVAFPNASCALTVNWNGTPAVVDEGAEMTYPAVVAGLTVTGRLAAIEGELVSVAVTVWLPAVFSVALKVPVPFTRGLSAGTIPWPSPVAMWTLPV
jgi:hypothetical protein